MKQLLQALMRIPEAEALAAAVETGGCPAAVTGLGGVHRTQIAGAIAQRTGRPLVMVCSDEGEAGRLAGDLEILLGEGEAPAAISGATITSNAVQEAVAKAFAAYNASKGA